MTPDEFRQLFVESIRLEIEKVYKNDEWFSLKVKLVSTEPNSSFDPIVIMEDSVYLPT